MLITRTLQARLLSLARKYPVLTVTGPRQSGKTTLCRMAFPTKPYLSFESPDLRAYAQDDPRGLLREYAGGAILDEVQRVPELLSYLQTEVDERPRKGRFILTASANLQLTASISQSLAGRTAAFNLLGLALEEVRRFRRPATNLYAAMFRGGYPALHERRLAPRDWFNSYVATYVERDVRQILNVGDLTTFQTFLRMCAARSGQLLNLSGLGADCGINHGTVRAWLSVLEATFQVRILRPYFANIGKRLVKTPKVYFTDVGTLCFLSGLRDPAHAAAGPMGGAIFETAVLAEVVKAGLGRGGEPDVYFWRTATGTEVDFVVDTGTALVPIETKLTATPRPPMAGGITAFQATLGAKAAPGYVIHPGTVRLPLAPRVTALPFAEL